eukprot:COSAG06_NODE_4242_length_4439_cov_4.769585_2_plen_407_part_00
MLGHLAAGAAPAQRATAEAASSVGDDDAATEALQHFLNTGISWDEPVPRLEIGSTAAAEHLAEHGFVVMRSALSAADCETALSLIWESLEGFGSGINRHDAQTWTNDRWPGQGQTGSGLTGVRGDYGLTHCDGSWFVRTRPGVIKAHAALFGTDDLLASFDGLALTRPWGLNPEHRPEQGLHWDRGWSPDDPDHVQYQGFVNLLPTTPTTGGNVVLAGMHRQYRAIMEDYYRAGGESPKGPHPHHLLRDRPELFVNKAINPHMEAGDLCECDTVGGNRAPHRTSIVSLNHLILSWRLITWRADIWDGRLLHCGMVPPSSAGSSEAALQRAMVLVCMRPRSYATDEALASRRLAFEAGVGAGANPTGTISVEEVKAELLENGRWDNFGQFKRAPRATLSSAQSRLVA